MSFPIYTCIQHSCVSSREETVQWTQFVIFSNEKPLMEKYYIKPKNTYGELEDLINLEISEEYRRKLMELLKE